MRRNTNTRVMLGFLTGLGVGLALLFSPLSGEETREWIADKSSEGLDSIRDLGRRSFERIRESNVVAEGKERISRAVNAGKEMACAGKDALEESGLVS
jgi:gas vesicle protein